jgi:hypothetical protein
LARQDARGNSTVNTETTQSPRRQREAIPPSLMPRASALDSASCSTGSGGFTELGKGSDGLFMLLYCRFILGLIFLRELPAPDEFSVFIPDQREEFYLVSSSLRHVGPQVVVDDQVDNDGLLCRVAIPAIFCSRPASRMAGLAGLDSGAGVAWRRASVAASTRRGRQARGRIVRSPAEAEEADERCQSASRSCQVAPRSLATAPSRVQGVWEEFAGTPPHASGMPLPFWLFLPP